MKHDLLIQKLSSKDKYIRLQKKLENNISSFCHYPPFWKKYFKELKDIDFDWKVVQYSNDDEVPDVQPNTPGIYLFVLKPNKTIFEEYCYVMYVGMTKEGLIERLSSGYKTPSGVKQRPHIHRLILDYSNYLLWYYVPFPKRTSKKKLKSIEKKLIGYFCDPPINRKDQPEPVAEAKKSKMS